MASQYIAQTPSAYGFPLLIKGLLESGVTRAPEQEIVSANQNRLTYWEFAERVGRLASGLAGLGVSGAIRWQSWIGIPIGIWSVSSRCQ